ncbi:MAG: metal-dependent hydrolase [Vicinamibacteria bacterium]
MPSPIAHGLAGLTIHLLASRDREELRDPWRIGVTVGAALVPDVDLLFRFVDGANHHSNETHSIGFAMLAAVTAAVAFRLVRWRRPVVLALALGLAWVSHVLLDLLNLDTHPPIGVMALWPISDGYFKSPVLLFLDIGRTLDWTAVRHNTVSAAWECVVLVPVLLVAWRYRMRHLGRPQWREGSRASP